MTQLVLPSEVVLEAPQRGRTRRAREASASGARAQVGRWGTKTARLVEVLRAEGPLTRVALAAALGWPISSVCSLKAAIEETNRRRAKQVAYNEEHSITPTGVSKRIKDLIDGVYDATEAKAAEREARYEAMSEKQIAREIKALEKKMLGHARNLE